MLSRIVWSDASIQSSFCLCATDPRECSRRKSTAIYSPRCYRKPCASVAPWRPASLQHERGRCQGPQPRNELWIEVHGQRDRLHGASSGWHRSFTGGCRGGRGYRDGGNVLKSIRSQNMNVWRADVIFLLEL